MILADCKPGAIVHIDNRRAVLFFVQRRAIHARWLDGDNEHAVLAPDTECALEVEGYGDGKGSEMGVMR